MDPRPLAPPEQYVYTNGACQVFVQAARRVVGGTPTVLVATDPRQLETHGWPASEPLDLHIYLTLDDGRVLDAEGIRSQEQLLRAFGVKRGYRHEVKQNAAEDALGKPNLVLVDKLACRLRDLGWHANAAPEAKGVLMKQATYRKAAVDARQWWPEWESAGALPEGEAQASAQAAGVNGVDTLELGETPFHKMSHLPDMIAGRLRKFPERIEQHTQWLTQERYCDGQTALHLVAENLAKTIASPFSPLGVVALVNDIHTLKAMDTFRARNRDGSQAAVALRDAMTSPGVATLAGEAWQQMLAMAAQMEMEGATAPASTSMRDRGVRL